jgi:sensor histidine kinase YesM
LEVTVLKDGDAIVAVFEDNGPAVDEARIADFQHRLQQPGNEPDTFSELAHVGLLNVHYRLQTYYQRTGAGIGVILDTNGRLGGVRVTVRFPDRRSLSGQGKEESP